MKVDSEYYFQSSDEASEWHVKSQMKIDGE